MSGNRNTFTAWLIGAVFLIVGTAQAGSGKSKGAHGNAPKVLKSGSGASMSVTVSAGISIGDARALATTYKLTGVKPLPPGIRKNLARGKPLPPGIQKTRMPAAFVERLPRHDGYEWRRAGADLVLVVSGTLVITDVLRGVFD